MIGETLNFGNVSGAASTATAVFTATGIITDINQSLASAGPELMQEYVNATGGPGGYVQTTANENGFVWDPNATPDTPGFIVPGKWFYLNANECLYYTVESDVRVELIDLDIVELTDRKTLKNRIKDAWNKYATAENGHLLLDVLGMIPVFGGLADVVNAGWYASEGNYAMASLSMAAIAGGGAVLLAVKYGGPAAKVVTKVASHVSEKVTKRFNKIFGKADEVLSSADDVTKQADEVVEGVAQGVGHTTPWSAMTRAEKRAFQHSYSRHSKELGLPNWAESKAADLQGLFNEAVTNIRNAGSNSFFLSQEWVNGVMTTVNRTEPIINGQKYFYYETLQGVFISAGKIP